MVVSILFVTTAFFITKVCTYTPQWLDYVIWIVASTVFIFVITGGEMKK
jgi:hypothetical protein